MTEKQRILKALKRIATGDAYYICQAFDWERLPSSVNQIFPKEYFDIEWCISITDLGQIWWKKADDINLFKLIENKKYLRETILCLALAAYDDLKD